MACLVNSFPGAHNLYHISVAVRTRDGDLSGSLQFDRFQLSSFTSDDESMMLLRDLEFSVGLISEGRG